MSSNSPFLQKYTKIRVPGDKEISNTVKENNNQKHKSI